MLIIKSAALCRAFSIHYYLPLYMIYKWFIKVSDKVKFKSGILAHNLIRGDRYAVFYPYIMFIDHRVGVYVEAAPAFAHK